LAQLCYIFKSGKKKKKKEKKHLEAEHDVKMLAAAAKYKLRHIIHSFIICGRHK